MWCVGLKIPDSLQDEKVWWVHEPTSAGHTHGVQVKHNIHQLCIHLYVNTGLENVV